MEFEELQKLFKKIDIKDIEISDWIPDIKDVDLGDKEPFDWEYFKEYLDSQKQLPTTIYCHSLYLNHLANGRNPKGDNTVLSLEKEKYND